MKFKVTVEADVEPEEFGRMVGGMIASVPPEVREQFITASAKAMGEAYGAAASAMLSEFMKQAGAATGLPSAVSGQSFNPLDPFGLTRFLQPPKKDGP